MIKKVLEFHTAFNIPIGNAPKLINADRAEMRQRILQEEVDELWSAINENDIVEIADGIVDAIYILLGTAIEYGLHEKLETMFNEVHRSNMSKLDENGNPIYREDGKVLKGPNFSKPDLKSILTFNERVFMKSY